MRVLQSDHPRPLDVLAIGAGGRVAAACSELGARADVEVWDLAAGAAPYAHPVHVATTSLAFTADGRFLLVAEPGAVGVLDATTREARPGLAVRHVRPWFALSADGRRLLVAEAHDGAGRVGYWEVSDGPTFREEWQTARLFPHWSGAPALDPDGRRAAVVYRSESGDRPVQTIQVRSAAARTVLWEAPHDAADPVQQLAFTADGSRLLARFLGRTVRAFDADTGAPAGELVHPGRPFVTGVAVHPGGKVAAASRTDGTVWLWDPAALRPLRSFDWKLGKLVSVAFSQ